MADLDLTFIVLAYNEEALLEATVAEVLAFLEKRDLQAPILIMDDGSTDGTAEIADRLAATHASVTAHHYPENVGQYRNIIQAFRMATTGYATLVPGDNQFVMESFEIFIPFIGEYDIVWGFPNNEGARGRTRVVLSHAWRLYLLFLFGISVTYLGGMMVLPRALVLSMEAGSGGYLGWYETAVRMVLSGATYIQLPFEIRDREGGQTNAVKPMTNALDVVRMVRIWRKLRGPGWLRAGSEHHELRNAYEAYLAEIGQDKGP